MALWDAFNPFSNDPGDQGGNWWNLLNPIKVFGANVKASDWLAMQVPAAVGTVLTAINGGNAADSFGTYERNLNAGLGYTPAPIINGLPWGNPNGQPSWDFGAAVQGGEGLFGSAAGHAAGDIFGPAAAAVIQAATPVWLPVALGGAAYLLLQGGQHEHH